MDRRSFFSAYVEAEKSGCGKCFLSSAPFRAQKRQDREIGRTWAEATKIHGNQMVA